MVGGEGKVFDFERSKLLENAFLSVWFVCIKICLVLCHSFEI